MPKKKYIVDLSEEERSELKQLLKKGKLGVRKVKRAQTLLLADQGQSDPSVSK